MNLPSQKENIPWNLLCNKSAISRIVNIPPSWIKELKSDPNWGAIAIGKNGERFKVSIKELNHEFHRYRMESGSELKAWKVEDSRFGERWSVEGKKGDTYQVEIFGSSYRCTCEDWHQHQTRCKHGWAVDFSKEATKKVSCHDCKYWMPIRGYCKLRAENDLEQLPITHAETCSMLTLDFEEF